MAVNFNPNLNSVSLGNIGNKPPMSKAANGNVDFAKAIGKSLKSVSDQQNKADASIVDLLSGRNEDVNSVIASVAKADMSFKLLVGVRNKLVEAYKETMKMSV